MLVDLFEAIIKPHIHEYHLDYGCGYGWITYYAAEKCPENRFVGYDIDKGKIRFANRRFNGPNLLFTSSGGRLLSMSPFESIGSSFVFHEATEKIFEDCSILLNTEGKICVLDYDLKGISLKEFDQVFDTKKERNIIEHIGLVRAYQTHTSAGLEECVKYGKNNGFDTVKSYRLLDKYFVWIGKK